MLGGTTGLGAGGWGESCLLKNMQKHSGGEPSVSRAARTSEGALKAGGCAIPFIHLLHLNYAESPSASKRRQLWYKRHH